MKLLVGLGNPGDKYKNTRHNVGFMVLDAIAKQIQSSKFKSEKKFNAEVLKIETIVLAKPQTFMNSSGEAVKKFSDFYKISPSDIYIIHDDLDIPIGKYKIQFGKGPQLHNGILSVEEELGAKDFWRVRVGIENRDPERRLHGEIFTLQDFTDVEMSLLQNVFSEIKEKLFAINHHA